jgi:hypothetical protein
LFGRDTRQDKDTFETIVGTKQNVRVKTITNHANTGSIHAIFTLQVVNHEWTWLSHHGWFFTGASLDGSTLRTKKQDEGYQQRKKTRNMRTGNKIRQLTNENAKW